MDFYCHQLNIKTELLCFYGFMLLTLKQHCLVKSLTISSDNQLLAKSITTQQRQHN